MAYKTVVLYIVQNTTVKSNEHIIKSKVAKNVFFKKVAFFQSE